MAEREPEPDRQRPLVGPPLGPGAAGPPVEAVAEAPQLRFTLHQGRHAPTLLQETGNSDGDPADGRRGQSWFVAAGTVAFARYFAAAFLRPGISRGAPSRSS